MMSVELSPDAIVQWQLPLPWSQKRVDAQEPMTFNPFVSGVRVSLDDTPNVAAY